MTLSTTTMTTAPRVHSGVIFFATTPLNTAESKGQNTAPVAKPPRLPVAHLSKGRPPHCRFNEAQPHARSVATSRHPAYTHIAAKTIGRGYDRPQTTRIEKRITILLFDSAHNLPERRRPALFGRSILPRIDENDVYPRPLPPPTLHPMVRTKARRPRSRTTQVQDENQPLAPNGVPAKPPPTKGRSFTRGCVLRPPGGAFKARCVLKTYCHLLGVSS
ncbi:hypothetical protein OH76DRAFT_1411642 [Lentinus brumalis]|uniref:Uncharacterized protein n=1 Tax=Lentinus brumalis TaxID=2498619 RepID=A0A371CNU7_9APHY|nr:hypothetical protein OH76DRAFT_1411642 [Polyporus brumalis]